MLTRKISLSTCELIMSTCDKIYVIKRVFLLSYGNEWVECPNSYLACWHKYIWQINLHVDISNLLKNKIILHVDITILHVNIFILRVEISNRKIACPQEAEVCHHSYFIRIWIFVDVTYKDLCLTAYMTM